MLNKNIFATLIPAYIISILLIIGCAFTSREVYVGRTMFIPVKSSPQGARVLLDGKDEGFTPMTLQFTYLQDKYGSHDDEIRVRILKIERDGYEPYVISFSITNKEHEKIPNPVFLKKSEDVVQAEASLDKEQQKTQEPKEVGEALKEVEKPRNKIALIDNAVDLPLKDQQKAQELKEAKEEVKESLKEITKPRNESALIKEKDDTQKIKQNNDTIEASSDKDDKNIVQTRSDKKIDNTTKFNKKLKVDSQYASKIIYTIQTGSFLKLEQAQEQYDSMLKILNGKESSFLRIEKIGKYYAVRLGRFNDYNAAEQFIVSVKPDLSNAVILEVYIKEERIVRFNAGSIYVLNDALLNTTDKSDHSLKEDLYLRQILVDTRVKAEDIIDRIAKGELFEEVALKESMESNGYAGGYVGKVDPSDLHPAIADVLLNNYESDAPVIVETERGFHIVQRGTRSDLKDSNKLMATDEKIAADRVAIKNQSNIESFKALIKINPLFSEAYYNLGVAYSESGEYSKAVDAYKEAIERNPYYFNAFVNLGVAYSKLDMYGSAINVYMNAINITPDDADVHINLGIALGRLGMYSQAITALKRATELDTHNAEAHYNLGFAYLMSNDKNSAINEYEILKNLDTELANKLFREIHE